MKKVVTLCIVHDGPNVLLGMKKRGFGAGNWNGFGGKVEKDETIYEATRREVEEEIGIKVENIEHVGILDFEFLDTGLMLECHVFSAKHFKGEPRESEEMRPRWYTLDEIPFKNMWPDDKYWFPYFLRGKKFYGKFDFEKDAIVRYSLAAL